MATKVLVLLITAGVFLLLLFGLRDQLTLEALGRQETVLRDYERERPFVVYAAAFLLYVAVAGLSIPGATVLTLSYGWFFGFWRALVIVSFASTAGATVAFLLSRYLLREIIERRFGDRLSRFNTALEREGPFYLFLLRVVPAVPFVLINLMTGLTPLPVRTYWWVSQVGMLPGTCVYVYAGSTVPSLQQLSRAGFAELFHWKLLLALLLLGIFPIAVKKLLAPRLAS